MDAFLRGFVSEIAKVAGEDPYREVLQEARREAGKGSKKFSIREGGGPVRRDYLTSTLISGATFPLVTLAGKMISRKMHNRDVMRAMAQASPGKKKQLAKEMLTGKLIGRGRPDLPSGERPMMTHGDLISDVGRGALIGSAVQAIRDRFSGAGKS